MTLQGREGWGILHPNPSLPPSQPLILHRDPEAVSETWPGTATPNLAAMLCQLLAVGSGTGSLPSKEKPLPDLG